MLTIRLALAALIVSATSCAVLAKKIEARLPKTFVSTKIVDRIAPDLMMGESSWGIDKSPMVARPAKKALPKTDLLPTNVNEPQPTARQDFASP